MLCTRSGTEGTVPAFGFSSPAERAEQLAWQEAHRAACPQLPARFYPAGAKG